MRPTPVRAGGLERSGGDHEAAGRRRLRHHLSDDQHARGKRAFRRRLPLRAAGLSQFRPGARACSMAGSDYAAHANDTIVTMAMIETDEAVNNVDEIMSRRRARRNLCRPQRSRDQSRQSAKPGAHGAQRARGGRYHSRRRQEAQGCGRYSLPKRRFGARQNRERFPVYDDRQRFTLDGDGASAEIQVARGGNA